MAALAWSIILQKKLVASSAAIAVILGIAFSALLIQMSPLDVVFTATLVALDFTVGAGGLIFARATQDSFIKQKHLAVSRVFFFFGILIFTSNICFPSTWLSEHKILVFQIYLLIESLIFIRTRRRGRE
jgi:hypothetical protein